MDKKKPKTKKKKQSDEDTKLSKEEKAVAKHLRFNCSVKESTMAGNEVKYFTGSKAVDCLLKSKWAHESPKQEAHFLTRESCARYLQTLLEQGMFIRARRLVPRQKEKLEAKPGVKSIEASKKEPEGKKEKSSDESKPAPSTSDKKDEEQKKKKKVKLEPHTEQVFIDGNEVYVWIFDPTSAKTWFLGSLIVVGSVLICLFPLWPPEVRLGIYYLSMAAMGFVGLIFLLGIVRAIIFASTWACTFGKHHFWIFPNLTEDCGFFDSFKPVYSHTYIPSETKRRESEPKEVKEQEQELAPAIEPLPLQAVVKEESRRESSQSDRKANSSEDEDEVTPAGDTTATGGDVSAAGEGNDASEGRHLRRRKKRQSGSGAGSSSKQLSKSGSEGSSSGFEIIDAKAD